MVGVAERLRPSTSVKDWLAAPTAIPAYVHPSDWLTLPAVTTGDQKFVGLYAVTNTESNFAAVNCAGAYTVDWGDGSAPANLATGVTAYHNYVFTDLNVSTTCSRGYRQAIVTITPQAGQDLTKVDLARVHNQPGLVPTYSTGWLDVRMAGSLVSTLIIYLASGPTHPSLERFEYVGPSSLTTTNNLFTNTGVRSVMGTVWTASVTDFTRMYFGTLVDSVPPLVTSSGVVFASMFETCRALVTIPPMDTSDGTNLSSMFSSCSNLESVPPLDTSANINFTSMFSGCSSLVAIPPLATGAGTAFTSMFQSCARLVTIPPLSTGAGTAFGSMFSGCLSLATVPPMDTSNGTVFTSMFSGCSSLVTIPALDTSKGTAVGSMFSGCAALLTIPPLDVGLAASLSSMFTGCAALRNATLLNAGSSVSWSGCALGPLALDDIYTNLRSLNRLSANAASVETSGADWNVSPVNCTVGTSAPSPVIHGTRALRLTALASGEMRAAITARIAVLGSTSYTFMASVRTAPGNPLVQCSVRIGWYDAGGALLSTDMGTLVSSVAATWVKLTVTATSPSGAVTASPVIVSNATAAAQFQEFDGMGFYRGTVTTWTLPATTTATVTNNWGTASDNPAIATAKGWTVTGS
jgi:hypothetical protein